MINCYSWGKIQLSGLLYQQLNPQFVYESLMEFVFWDFLLSLENT
jgi:hypothetical protein